MKKIILILFLLNFLKSECLEGCLTCNPRDECLFCDGLNNYILDTATCKKVFIENCDIIDLGGKCLICKDGFYRDRTTFNCVELTSETSIENCKNYEEPSQCSLCKDGYILNSGACEKQEIPIENCIKMNPLSPNQCLTCKTDHLLSLSGTECTAITTLENCASYSELKCEKCSEDYLIDYNKYIDNIYVFNDANSKFIIQQKIMNDQDSNINQGNHSLCKSISVDNCEEYQSYRFCSKCSAGYFLTVFKECEKYPLQQIEGCEIYIDGTTCGRCKDGLFLQSSNICQSFEAKPPCIKYNPASSEIECIECESDYFLNDQKICEQRTVLSTFEECEERSLVKDQCLSCKDGKVLTDDFQSCLPAVVNCKQYGPSDKNSSELQCDKCVEGWYYSSLKAQCVEGTVENCFIYSDQQNTCAQCIDGYYLGSGTCLEHTPLDLCLKYDYDAAKTCFDCDTTSLKFEVINGCLKGNENIKFCKTLSSQTTCGECELNYWPDEEGICELITTPTNCRKKDKIDQKKCAMCNSQYYILDGVCLLPEDYFTLHCASHNVNGVNLFSQINCEYCKENAIPMLYYNNYVCTKNSSVQNSITNCLKYRRNPDGSLECILCDNDLILSSDLSSCDLACNNNETIQYFQFETIELSLVRYHTLRHFKKCVEIPADTVSNIQMCAHSYPNMIATQTIGTDYEFDYVCAKCNTISFPVILPDKIIVTNDPINVTYGYSVLSAFPGLRCVMPQTTGDTAIVTHTIQQIDHCQYYYLYETIVAGNTTTYKYGCISCNQYYHGQYNANKYIESCVYMSDCDQENQMIDGILQKQSEFEELHTAWSTYFSCYACTNPKAIPFVAVEIPADVSLMPTVVKYNLTNTTSFKTFGGSEAPGYNTFCAEPVFSSFPSIGEANFAFVDNCALGVLNILSDQNSTETDLQAPNGDKAAVYCLACKKGYLPLKMTNSGTGIHLNGVYQCQPAGSNCDANSTWFNACSNCIVGNIYKYDTNLRTIDYTECYPFPDSNCLAFYTDNSKDICQFCKKGYSLNLDGICKIINSSKCSTNQMNFFVPYQINLTSQWNNLGIYLSPYGAGCQKCLEGYVATEEISSSAYYCTFSDYVAESIYQSGTNLKENCKNYTIREEEIICKVCKTNFIPSQDGNCYLQTNQPSCVELQIGGTICQKCKEGFVVVSGVCEKKALEKCSIYNEGVSVTEQSCAVCEPDHYWNETACARAVIDNCEVLKSDKQCKQCKEGYYLIITKDSTDYCYPYVDKSSNCAKVSQIKFFPNFQIECVECNEGYALSQSAESHNNTACLQFIQIENCFKYDIKTNIEESTLDCVECESNYYLKLDKKSSCEIRTQKIDNCEKYKIEADECESCQGEFYVSSDGLSCIEYPQGINGCIEYSSASFCVSCDVEMYLSSNQCLKVESKFLLDKCVYYNEDKSCKLCEQGYAQENGLCVEAQAKNCKTYKGKIACESCEKNYGFQEINSIIHCVQKNVAKCDVSENYYPFKCLICENNYYPDETGVCQEVSSQIKDCIQYQSDTKCSKCKKGTTLSKEQDSCIDANYIQEVADLNCEVNKITQPFCQTCKPGYVMNANGVCSKCESNSTDSGCYVCNPIDMSKCIICMPGYYQTKDTKCVQSNKDTGTDETTNEETEVEDVSFVGLKRMVLMVLLSVMII